MTKWVFRDNKNLLWTFSFIVKLYRQQYLDLWWDLLSQKTWFLVCHEKLIPWVFVTNIKIAIIRNCRMIRIFCDTENIDTQLAGTFGFNEKYLFVIDNGPFYDGNAKTRILLLQSGMYPSQLSPTTSRHNPLRLSSKNIFQSYQFKICIEGANIFAKFWNA